MALTDKQKAKVVFYLGWPGLTLKEGSTHFNSVVNDRVNAVSDCPALCEIAKDVLKKIENIDKCLEKAKCRLAASQVDEITMNENEIMKLNKERRRCIKELSRHFDIGYMGSGSNIIGVCV